MKLSEVEASVIVGGRGGCKEHPNNKQQQGVCPSCLRDKLSNLCNSKLDKLTYYSPPRSPSHRLFSSFTSFDYVSPAYQRRHRRHASHAADSVSSMIGLNHVHGLNKSKSVAFVSRNRPREREDNQENMASKKHSFWWKLLKLTRKDKSEAIKHSGTTRRPKA